jgi:hypothetical protein
MAREISVENDLLIKTSIHLRIAGANVACVQGKEGRDELEENAFYRITGPAPGGIASVSPRHHH